MQPNSQKGSFLTMLGVASGVGFNVLAVFNECLLLRVPPGSHIRPMGIAVAMFAIAFASGVIVGLLALLLILKNRLIAGAIVLFLAFSPICLSYAVGRYIVAIRSLTLLP